MLKQLFRGFSVLLTLYEYVTWDDLSPIELCEVACSHSPSPKELCHVACTLHLSSRLTFSVL